jgi:glycosyltransferase involved in cell wall biosynthesis
VAGYVGTHGMAHALHNVLDAAERVKADDRIRFLLVGAGAERDALISTAKQRGLSNVVFAPMQPKARMPAVWSLCDVALVHLKDAPAFAEVIPSKIFEAMAMGLPLLVATPDGVARRLVEEDRAGLTVPAENPAALAEAILRLAADDALRSRLAAAALAAAPKYTRARQADAMLNVLRAAAA